MSWCRSSARYVVLLAEADAPAEILAALEGGAKGYISTSENVKVLIGGITLAPEASLFRQAAFWV